MRVLLDARLGRRRAGIERYTQHLLSELGPLAPGVVRPVVKPRHVRLAAADGLTPWIAWPGRLRPGGLPDADVVHGPSFAVELPHARARRVATVHDLGYVARPDLHPPGFGAALDAQVRAALASTDRWLCDSAFTRDAFLTHYGADPERCEVVLLGVDRRTFSPGVPGALARAVLARHAVRGPFVLHVGSLVPRKDVGTLLAAWERLAVEREDLHLVLAGNPMRRWATDWPQVQAWRTDRPRLAGRVAALGHVPTGALPGLYRAAAVVASTAVLEGFGLPVLEALACGRPVVATGGSAVEEWAGRTVRTVPVGDPAAVAAALADVLAAPPDPAAGLALASELSWRRTAERTLAAYARAAA